MVQTLKVLADNPRIIGIAAGGSYATGIMDEHSDIDLVVVSDESLQTDTAARMEIARSLGPLLSAFVGYHVGEPRLLICLYGPPIVKVDLKFVTSDDLRHRVEDPVILYDPSGLIANAVRETLPSYPMPDCQWIEDAFWIWIQAAAAKLRRGELFEANALLNFMIEKVLGPLALMEGGHQPSGVRRLEFYAPNRAAELSRLYAGYDRDAIKHALQQAAALYVFLRKGVEYRSQAEEESIRYLAES